MTFEPNTVQLEIIAIMVHARTPVARIAAVLGVTLEEFTAFAGRLAMGRAYVPAVTIPPKPERMVAKSPRIVAQRLFETI